MPRPRLEAQLERLSRLRSDPHAATARQTLREVLAGPHAHAVAAAARIAADAQLYELEPELASAFERLMEHPVKRDPGCRGKADVVDALQQLDASRGELYLRAARHVQPEPVYGGRQDTAGELRGAAGRGLARCNHPDALPVLAELLADPELPARMAAVRAVAWHGGPGAMPLLRLKALTGDPEPAVTGDCLLGLLQISAEDSLDFVGRFLEGELSELAVLALGESRVPGALALLQDCYATARDPDRRRSALLGVAMLRSDEAVAWLLERIASEPGPVARQVIEAFEIHRGDEALVERVRRAAGARRDVDLRKAVREWLD